MESAPLPELEFDKKLFLDRSIILYGASDTGKSTVIVDILYHLRKDIDQIFVYSRNEESNSTYEGIVPKAAIKHHFKAQDLEELWARQDALAFAYNKANHIEILESVFNKLEISGVSEIIHRAQQERSIAFRGVREQFAGNPQKTKEAEAKLEKTYNEFFVALYKTHINRNRHRAKRADLNEDEMFAVKYMDFNPRLLLVIDDCGSDLAALKKHPLINDLFTMGRHKYITFLITIHDDKLLPSELRKNAFVSVFTTRQCATALFSRSSNHYDKALKIRAERACEAAFVEGEGPAKFQKLIYIRKGDMFFRFTAKTRGAFTFGSQAFQDYMRLIEADGLTIDKNNKYYSLL
jgi:hypothetical protein